ncbi:MAG: class I adenylate-forming enzyme family protein [Gemmatimonadales bacterium]
METLDTPLAEFPPGEDAASLIAGFAATQPDRTALIQDDRVVTWREMNGQICRASGALAALGVGKGDRVAVLSRNSIEYAEVFVGILAAGACTVPLPTMASSEALELMLRDSGSKVVIVSSAYRDLVAPFVDRLEKLVPGGKIGFDFSGEGWTAFESSLSVADGKTPSVRIESTDDFNIIYSSGTTGVPKGIVHNHAQRRTLYIGMRAFGFNAEGVHLVSVPLYSNTTMATWLPAICGGSTNVLMAKFDAEEALSLIQKHGVTHAMFIPVQYDRFMRLAGFDRFDLSSMQWKFSTSAPLRAELKRQLIDRFPGELVELYGLTEGGIATLFFVNQHPDKLDSVGPAAPGFEIKVIDEEGRELPPGMTGEIVGRGPNMMRGYLNRKEATREMLWRDREGRLFFRSGDVGRMDEEGFIYLLDRKKDVIISGGLNIYATDLEMVLSRHEAVREAAVVGIPSDEWGETPLGLVVPEPSATISAEELREWANARLGKSQRIARIELRDELPKSDIGKVLKRVLREPFWKEASRTI